MRPKQSKTACGKCGALNEAKEISSDPRWVLYNDLQICTWKKNTDATEPYMIGHISQVVAYFCCEEHALKASNKRLAQFGAVVQGWSVKPVETCACCGGHIDTSQWHRVLNLSLESGNEQDPKILSDKDLGRFCTACAPHGLPSEGVTV